MIVYDSYDSLWTLMIRIWASRSVLQWLNVIISKIAQSIQNRYFCPSQCTRSRNFECNQKKLQHDWRLTEDNTDEHTKNYKNLKNHFNLIQNSSPSLAGQVQTWSSERDLEVIRKSVLSWYFWKLLKKWVFSGKWKCGQKISVLRYGHF